MTTFGKVLAFVNLVIGVSLLAWGVSVYANKADWVDRKADGATVEGEITRLKNEIAQLTKTIDGAQAAYGTRATVLAQTEATRDFRKRVLDSRLDEARRGTFRVQLPIANDKAYVDVSPQGQGQPILGPDNKPLRGVDALVKDFNDQVRQAELHRRGDQPVQPNEWNDLQKLLGGQRLQTLGIDDLRTLHGKVSDQIAAVDVALGKQKDILVNLGHESEVLADQRVDWSDRLQTLQRRQKQVEDKLRDLGAPAASGGGN